MEHRGVEYRIIQGIQRGLWKWSVETGTGTKSGISDSKDAAMAAAKRAIDNSRSKAEIRLRHLACIVLVFENEKYWAGHLSQFESQIL